MTLAGSIDEGAVFGGLFLDLVLRSGGLNDVVEAILASKAVNFGQFRTWCNANRPGIATVLDDVVGTWEWEDGAACGRAPRSARKASDSAHA